jgi:hypothetical protein
MNHTVKPLFHEVEHRYHLRLRNETAHRPVYTHMVVFSVLKDGYVHVEPYAWDYDCCVWVTDHAFPHPYTGTYPKDQARQVWNYLVNDHGYIHVTA